MIKLPKWVLPNTYPAIYDGESATALEMVAKLYGSMNELIEDYNKFIEDLNTKFNEFTESNNKNDEIFKIGIRQEFQDFIDVIELKMQEHTTNLANLEKEINNTLDETVKYLKNKANETITEVVNEMVANNELSIQFAYNEDEERIDTLFITN